MFLRPVLFCLLQMIRGSWQIDFVITDNQQMVVGAEGAFGLVYLASLRLPNAETAKQKHKTAPSRPKHRKLRVCFRLFSLGIEAQLHSSAGFGTS